MCDRCESMHGQEDQALVRALLARRREAATIVAAAQVPQDQANRAATPAAEDTK